MLLCSRKTHAKEEGKAFSELYFAKAGMPEINLPSIGHGSPHFPESYPPQGSISLLISKVKLQCFKI